MMSKYDNDIELKYFNKVLFKHILLVLNSLQRESTLVIWQSKLVRGTATLNNVSEKFVEGINPRDLAVKICRGVPTLVNTLTRDCPSLNPSSFYMSKKPSFNPSLNLTLVKILCNDESF